MEKLNLSYRRLTINIILIFYMTISSCNQSENNITDDNNALIINSLQIIKDDMSKPHAGEPQGILPIFDWATHPRVGYGNNPPIGWSAMLPWGQIYFSSLSNSAPNTRFQIRNIQAWYISKSDNTWKKWIHTSNIDGANFAEDFQNNINIPADIKQETEEGGVSSFLVEGYNFHFWSNDGRITIDPNDIDGVWVSIESRLILDNIQLTDDRAKAKFLFSAGADYWSSLDAQWDNFNTNGDIGIGRFRFITNNWQAFNMHTLTEEQLNNNPPPF